MAEAALVAHIVAQTRSNISFLQNHGYLSTTQATKMQEQLGTTSVSGSASVLNATMPSIPRSVPVVPTAPQLPTRTTATKAKAIWAYNEDGSDPNDLSFSVGEIIEIVSEDNADWWTGRVRGREGLFPSNYVEKLQPQSKSGNKYRPFMAAYHGSDLPTPAAENTPPAKDLTTPATNSIGLQQAPGQEQKKSKFGAYGNTMAHSAAGGVGFGAGAAIGGGLVRAIF